MSEYLPPLRDLAGWRAGRAQPAAQLLGQVLERIQELNPRYRAFSHLSPTSQARAQQLDLAAGETLARPLTGAIVSIKGNIPVAGMPWTEGSCMHKGRIATSDAEIVARARKQGGIIVGTTTLSELAMYAVENAFEPMGLNPWNPGRTAGGSSTGAGVAAALGLAHVNIGTDSGGSIRNPACHCGVVGFMPRVGDLPDAGLWNYAPTFTSVGLIGRSVSEVRIAYESLRGAQAPLRVPDGSDRSPAWRLIVPGRLVAQMCDDETLSLFDAARHTLEAGGFTLIDHDVDSWLKGEAATGVLSLNESRAALEQLDLAKAGDNIRRRLQAAQHLDVTRVKAAESAIVRVHSEMVETLRRYNAQAFLTPTWPFAAPGMNDEEVLIGSNRVPIDPHRNCFVRLANGLGASAMTVPMGVYPAAGVPAGLHLMSLNPSSHDLLRMAQSMQALLPPMPRLVLQ